MQSLSDEQFEKLINRAFDGIKNGHHKDAIENVAIVMADDPSDAQRTELGLGEGETLLGLYTGVPLPQRHGRTNVFPPDVITLYKNPLLAQSVNEDELYENIRHTLWHELAHYFGLDHDKISELE